MSISNECLVILYTGSEVTFRAIGVTYVVVMLIFAVIQYLESDTNDRPEEKEDQNFTTDDDPVDVETKLTADDDGGATLRQPEESNETGDISVTPLNSDGGGDVTEDVREKEEASVRSGES